MNLGVKMSHKYLPSPPAHKKGRKEAVCLSAPDINVTLTAGRESLKEEVKANDAQPPRYFDALITTKAGEM